MKDLSDFAAPRQSWLAAVVSLGLQPPTTLACEGRRAVLFSFFQTAQQKCSSFMRTKKDGKEQRYVHPTSRLGVSRR